MTIHALYRIFGSVVAEAHTFDDAPPAGPRPDGSSVEDEIFASASGFRFYWSRLALRRYAVGLAICAVATAPVMLSDNAFARAVCTCWFVLLAVLAHGLARRAVCCEPVLVIDAFGIMDRRRHAYPLHWHEIRKLDRVDVHRNKVVELFLARPERMAGPASLWFRLGARLQCKYGLPAVTINLLLLDASCAEVVAAIAEYRCGLVPAEMQQATARRHQVGISSLRNR